MPAPQFALVAGSPPDRTGRAEGAVAVSVVVPVAAERADQLPGLVSAVREALGQAWGRVELVVVTEGDAAPDVGRLGGPDLTVLAAGRPVGEAAALAAGFARARGTLVVSLPTATTVDPADLPRLLGPLSDGGVDLVVARRDRPHRSAWDRLQGRIFHGLVARLTGTRLSDLSSGVVAMRREVAAELRLYGDLHRFLPILAAGRGFRVHEVTVRSAPGSRRPHVYPLGTYTRRLLDLLTVFFLLKFTRKPLRFFGLIGSALAAAGGLLLAYLAVDRLLGHAIGDRPLLLLGVLLLVLGVQAVGLGLIGELLIYTRRSDTDGYAVDRVSD